MNTAIRRGAWVLGLLFAFVLGWFVAPREPAGGVEAEAVEGTVWTCSMHPQIRQPEPGSCPICGMDLIPADAGPSTSAGERVVLSERARTLARLRTTPVSRQGSATVELRLLGRIEPDESTRKTVTSWVGGRVDHLAVRTTGETIRAGQVVATLYAPEVYAAHQDLLAARRQLERLGEGSTSAASAARAALEAAEDRLRLLGLPDSEVERMARAATPARAVPIRSPFGGTVIERVATEGSYVQTGSPLFHLADLRNLWVQLDAYESDLPHLAVGQKVELRVEGIPGERFEGTVAFVDPTLDPRRRTARVRVEVPNPDGRLRPGMFAEAVVYADARGAVLAPLVIPASAPLFTGKRAVVYVEKQDESTLSYEPRTVRLGPRLGDLYPVVAGLTEGERVVTRGAFALDADLQIQGGPSMMTLPDDRVAGPWDDVIQLPEDERRQLVPVMEAYLVVQRALAEDDHAAAVRGAQQLREAVGKVRLTVGEDAWGGLAPELRGHATHIERSGDLQGARAGFEPLSAAVEALLRTFGNPLDASVALAYCPMADDNRGATWIQQGDTVDNAYFGAAMRRCGEIREEVAPGSYLAAPGIPSNRAAAGGHVH